MAELTSKVEADLVLDKKLDADRYGEGLRHNFIASQELTVTITLSEYRALISGIATKEKDIEAANSGKYQREQEIKDVKAANDALKAENYDLKVKQDELKGKIDLLEGESEQLESSAKAMSEHNKSLVEQKRKLQAELDEARKTIDCLSVKSEVDDE